MVDLSDIKKFSPHFVPVPGWELHRRPVPGRQFSVNSSQELLDLRCDLELKAAARGAPRQPRQHAPRAPRGRHHEATAPAKMRGGPGGTGATGATRELSLGLAQHMTHFRFEDFCLEV